MGTRRARFVRLARAVAAVSIVSAGLAVAPGSASAASYVVSDGPSCLSFLSAIGGTGEALSTSCLIAGGTLPAGDTLRVPAEWGISLQQPPDPTFVNKGTITIEGGFFGFYNSGHFRNEGTFTTVGGQNYETITNTGTFTVNGEFFLRPGRTFTNEGTVTCGPAGRFITNDAGSPILVGTFPASCDGIAPTITASATLASGGAYTPGTWTDESVTVSFVCDDFFSGVKTCPASQTVTDGAATVTGTVVDNNGNTASASVAVKVDTTGPTVTPTATTSDGAAYVAGTTTSLDVTVKYACSDEGSGVVACPADDVVTAEGSSSFTHDVFDNLGNKTTVSFGPVVIRKTPPAVSCGSVSSSWFGTNASVACTASDPGAGLKNPADASFSLSTSVAAGMETDAAFTGSRPVESNSGLSTTVGPFGPFKVDLKAPSITISAPTGSPMYLLGQVVNAGYSCADGGSGVASCVGSVASGARLDTSTAGAKTLTVNAADAVGNRSSASASYSVGYTFKGLFAPVSNVGIQPGAAGKTVPLKWSLSGAGGTRVSALSSLASVTYRSVPCPGTTGPTGPVTTASGSLSYSNGEFKYEWKTPRAAGCYTVTLTLNSGQTFTATFNLRR